MKPQYIFEISWRNLMSRKIRSIITISGVIIGITTIIFLTSLGYGVEEMTTSQIASKDALYVFDTGVDESDIAAVTEEDLVQINNLENVNKVEPGVKIAGRISNGFVKTDVVLNGYSREFLDLANTNVYKGAKYNNQDEGSMLVSTATLKLMNIELSEYSKAELEVDMLSSEVLTPSISDGEIVNLGKYKIIGIIDDELSPFVVVPLKSITKTVPVTSYNEVKVHVENKEKLEETREIVEKMGFSTSYLGDTIKQISTIFVIFRYVIGGFGLISMLVAVLGMFNTLTVSLLERTREIGVLKANNSTKKDIFFIFLSEALIISFIGGILGILNGFIIGKLVNYWFNFYAMRSGSEVLDLFYLPTIFVVLTLVVVIIVGFLTGFYPALRATKIKILDALKYE